MPAALQKEAKATSSVVGTRLVKDPAAKQREAPSSAHLLGAARPPRDIDACGFTNPPGKRTCSQKPAANSAYCNDHVGQRICAWERCGLEQVPGSRFCSTHKCPVCVRGAYRGRDTGQCFEHQLCSAPECTRYCTVGVDSEPGMCCKDHRFCLAPEQHCEEVVRTDETSCPRHRCGVARCQRYRDQVRNAENAWCQDHACTKGTCLNRIEDTAVPQSRNCVNHTCRLANCLGQTTDDRQLCHQHCCGSAGCGAHSEPGNVFCAEHKCRDADCQLIAKVPGGFCVARSCTAGNCGEVRADAVRDLCARHTFLEGERAGLVRNQGILDEQREQIAQLQQALEEQQARRDVPRPREPFARDRGRDEPRRRAQMHPHPQDHDFPDWGHRHADRPP
ncbi:hypothetical protein AK830_g2841 [Neonectria ditissima]|uniref:Uncharacterized protein n=1 Tax=Neonectria ditissima TaxID=78410 RepID=A0A0N8H860_9HYPO|nr:hypothetical protein AK830_g2841 [Neonectria ditissima]